MIVVADTSPLNYLIQLGVQELLLQIYERVIVPEAVMRELGHASAPTQVREWLDQLPSWLDVREVEAERHEGLRSLGVANARQSGWRKRNMPT
jgi:predicted nucleic acid-binding protein